MKPRMKSPLQILPNFMDSYKALTAAAMNSDVPPRTLELVRLRASQINGCAMGVDLLCHLLKKGGEKDERIFSVAVWREAPWFTDAERAALALTEAGTRIADKGDPVPDEIWNEAARHYNETQLASLVATISFTNLINRVNVMTRQLAGSFRG